MFIKRNKLAIIFAFALVFTSIFSFGVMGQDAKDYTTYDARIALRAAVKIIILSEEQIQNLNVTGTGTVSVRDARLILRYAVGIIKEFPTVTEPNAFVFPDKSTFKLEMDTLTKTDYKVGETLEVTTSLTNTSSQSYGIIWGGYLIKVWLERVGDDPLPTITPMGYFYFTPNKTFENHKINGIGQYMETCTFKKAGTYKLTISASFDVCDFTGTEEEWDKATSDYSYTDIGKGAYSYTLPTVIITVTE